jgi:hypothetical protein
MEKYHPPFCLVINKSLQTTVRIRETEVRFLTIWNLLLDKDTF